MVGGPSPGRGRRRGILPRRISRGDAVLAHTGRRLEPCAIALSPDSSSLAIGTFQGTLHVSGPDGELHALAGHAGTIWSLSFCTADPALLMSSGGAGGVALWDLDSPECCYQAVGDQTTQVQLSDDGRTLAALLPTGPTLLDLGYRERHIAGNLEHQLDLANARGDLLLGREAELRRWAATVRAMAWPRWP